MSTVKIDRGDLLKRLAMVLPGLSTQEVIEQSSCYVFREGRIWTFNDDIVSSVRSSPAMKDMECAIPGGELRGLLEKLQGQDELELLLKSGGEGAELALKAKNSRAGIRIQREILLPIDHVNIPDSWRKVPDDLFRAVEMVEGCASKDRSRFALSCLRFARTAIEAIDGYQAIRFRIKTGLEKPVLVKREDLLKVLSPGLSEWAVGDSWLFFHGDEDLVIGCRLWNAEFPDVSSFFQVDGGREVALPEALEEALDKAEVFLDEDSQGRITVSLNESRLVLRGEGQAGWYEERLKTSYEGEPIRFRIAPRLLREVCSRATTKRCLVGENRLVVTTKEFDYVSSMSLAEDPS